MDTFEAARLKYQKNRDREAKTEANRAMREAIPEKREVQQAVLLTPKEVKQVMHVKVSGPHEMEFKVHYGGTLISSQQTESEMRRILRKQLSVMGMVE